VPFHHLHTNHKSGNGSLGGHGGARHHYRES
jgi:hypothetical protein